MIFSVEKSELNASVFRENIICCPNQDTIRMKGLVFFFLFFFCLFAFFRAAPAAYGGSRLGV